MVGPQDLGELAANQIDLLWSPVDVGEAVCDRLLPHVSTSFSMSLPSSAADSASTLLRRRNDLRWKGHASRARRALRPACAREADRRKSTP